MPLGTIASLKEQKPVVSGQSLLLALFTFADGTQKGYCSHDLTAFTYAGVAYEPRIVNMGLVERQALSADGIDFTPTVTVPLQDADKGVTKNYEFGIGKGFLGATLTLTQVIWQVGTSNFSSDFNLIFTGICALPEVKEDIITVTATSKFNMTVQKIPNTPIQRTCPWQFPATKAERVSAAVNGLNDASTLNLWRCGYSPDVTDTDVPGGTAAARGNLNSGTPYTSCGYTRQDCINRLGTPASGLIQIDTSSRATGNFGGITFVPEPLTTSKGYLSSKTTQTLNDQNAGKYGDYFPLALGTGWMQPKVMHSLGNQDITSMECVLCVGQIDTGRIQRVLVNGVTIDQLNTDPSKQQIQGYWTVVNDGGRHGTPNTDTFYNVQKPDPYGNLACIHIRVPNALAAASQIPQVSVLFTGPKIRRYQNIISASASGGVITVTKSALTNSLVDAGAGTTVTIEGCSFAAANGTWVTANNTVTSFQLVGSSATGSGSGGYFHYSVSDNNLTWSIVDVLLRARLSASDLDIPSAIASAAVDDIQINYTNLAGATAQHARFSTSLMLTSQQTVASLIRGLRNSGRKLMVPNSAGLIRILSKQTLADQQSAAIAGSNYNTPVASIDSTGAAKNGYVAYSFTEADMLELNGKNPLTFPARAITDLPNKLSCQFQDSDNQYQVDSFTLVDIGAVTRWQQETPQDAEAIGFNSYDQARRALNTMQAEAFLGNEDGSPDVAKGTRYIEFPTSIKGSHLQLGDIVLVSNTHFGITNQLFRLTKIQPTQDSETINLGMMWHEDEWYTDLWGQVPDSLFTGQNRNKGIRPPFPWRANETAPPANDPWYDPTENFFGVAQNYTNAADRTALAHISITGVEPVTSFSLSARPPLVPLQGNTANTGGTIKGGFNYWAKLVAKDATGSTFGMSAPSDLILISVPAGANTNTITIGASGLAWAPGTFGYILLMGTDPNNLSFQSMVDATPSSITLTTYNVANYGEPDVQADHVEVDVYKVEHSGNFGIAITGLTSTTFTVANALWTANQWAGYDCSITGFLNDAGDIPICNFTIASNTSDTLTLAASQPNPVALGVAIGDVLIMRSKPTVSGRTLTDANWNNSLATQIGQQVLAASNASPIAVTVTAHGYLTGDQVRIDLAAGNTAANGIWTITKIDANNFSLNGSTGNGAYTGSGIAKRLSGGLTPSEEVGNIVIIVAGTGRKQRKKIASNTATAVTVDSDWLIAPDSTSRYIIVDAAPLATAQGASSVANGNPTTPTSIDIPVDNLPNQSLAVIAYMADAQGNRSFDYLAQVREIFQFGGAGVAASFQGSINLTIDGTLAIGSDQAPSIALNTAATAIAVNISVKQAPTGAALVAALYVGGALWMTLTIPSGSTATSATGSQITGAASIAAGANVRIDLTAVGTTSPGSDLTAQIYY